MEGWREGGPEGPCRTTPKPSWWRKIVAWKPGSSGVVMALLLPASRWPGGRFSAARSALARCQAPKKTRCSRALIARTSSSVSLDATEIPRGATAQDHRIRVPWGRGRRSALPGSPSRIGISAALPPGRLVAGELRRHLGGRGLVLIWARDRVPRPIGPGLYSPRGLSARTVPPPAATPGGPGVLTFPLWLRGSLTSSSDRGGRRARRGCWPLLAEGDHVGTPGGVGGHLGAAQIQRGMHDDVADTAASGLAVSR